MNLSSPLLTYVINLDRDIARMRHIESELGSLSELRLERMPAVLASSLPKLAQRRLTGTRRDPEAGALGCFLAHIKAWEHVVRVGEWALIVEDDAAITDIAYLRNIKLPQDSEFIFANQRSNPVPLLTIESKQVDFVETIELLRYKALPSTKKSAPGTDGYLLSPEGAKKLLGAIETDGCHGHIDWRLLRYTLSPHHIQESIAGTWMEKVRVLSTGADSLPWKWNVIRAYCMSPSLIRVRQMDSTRKLNT